MHHQNGGGTGAQTVNLLRHGNSAKSNKTKCIFVYTVHTLKPYVPTNLIIHLLEIVVIRRRIKDEQQKNPSTASVLSHFHRIRKSYVR